MPDRTTTATALAAVSTALGVVLLLMLIGVAVALDWLRRSVARVPLPVGLRAELLQTRLVDCHVFTSHNSFLGGLQAPRA